MNNYDARKDFGFGNFNLSGSSDMMQGVTGMGYPPPGVDSSMDMERQRMPPHSYQNGGFTGDSHQGLMTPPQPQPLTSPQPQPLTSPQPQPLTSNPNQMYSPRSQSNEVRPIDITYAMPPTISAQQNMPLLELLNSSPMYSMPDEGGMKNAVYQQLDMGNMVSSVAPSNTFNSSMTYSTSTMMQSKSKHEIKLEQPFATCDSGDASSNSNPTNKSTNVVSSTSVDGKEQPKTPVSSCPSSPFSEYEDDKNDKRANIDSFENGSETNSANQSTSNSSNESYMSSQSGNNASHVTTSGASLLMGNHWTSHAMDLQDPKPEPANNDTQLDSANSNPLSPLSPIHFKLKVNDADGNEATANSEEDSRKRKSSVENSIPQLENQMPNLGEEYLAKLQQRLKIGCQNGEVLSVESEACLRQIQDPIGDLERGSIMFELSHAYGALLTRIQQINAVPEKGRDSSPMITETPENQRDANGKPMIKEQEFKDIMGAKICTMVTFVKSIPGMYNFSFFSPFVFVFLFLCLALLCPALHCP